MGTARVSLVLLSLLAFVGCGGGGGGDGDDDVECSPNETRCAGNTFQVCTEGEWTTGEFCPGACDAQRGCQECTPDTRYCEGEVVYQCTTDGQMGAQVDICTGNAHCTN